jgi:hypothetical protein
LNKPTPRPQHPLVGTGLHFTDDDGIVERQAAIIEVVPSGSTTVGDLALIQYFEFFMGAPSTRRLIPLSELASTERWVFYASTEEMNEHYQRVDQRRLEAKLKREERTDG